MNSSLIRICLLFSLICLIACTAPEVQKEVQVPLTVIKDTVRPDTVQIQKEPAVRENHLLNELAAIIGGNLDSSTYFSDITSNKAYKSFRMQFLKRWTNFDTTRIRQLTGFYEQELKLQVKPEPVLFYPFSGPDFLYPSLFFPEASQYILIGLEPVGTFSALPNTQSDSLVNYFKQVNTSINALLQFSFFRTNSMEKDLKSKEVDGVVHLIFLFLNRTGNQIVSANTFNLDSLGNKVYFSSFDSLKQAATKTSGLEIVFLSPKNEKKELNYFSLNASDAGLRKNKGFSAYLSQMKQFNTYLKGASYLLHKPYFSIIRKTILNGSSTVVQDDSGIALHYFGENNQRWDYQLYGSYTKPISMFSKLYQADLDSLYRLKGAKTLGFGIGYNFKDKNSNLMVAVHQ